MPATRRPTLPDDIQHIVGGLRWIALGTLLTALGAIGLFVLTVPWPSLVANPASNREAALGQFVAQLGGWGDVHWMSRKLLPRCLVPGIVLLVGTLMGLYGKGVTLLGIDDPPTRRLLVYSIVLDLAAWALAVWAQYPRSDQPLALRASAAVLGPFSRAAWSASAILIVAFGARAASVLSHDELLTDTYSLRRWLVAFLIVFVFAVAVSLLGEGKPVAPFNAPARRVFGYIGAALFGLSVLGSLLLALALSLFALRVRRALRLWAEAQLTPVPKQWV